jgi:hypothetical protein
MKYVFLIIAITVLFFISACDNRVDYLGGLNKKPTLLLVSKNSWAPFEYDTIKGVLSDSIKWIGAETKYSLKYIYDNENPCDLHIAKTGFLAKEKIIIENIKEISNEIDSVLIPTKSADINILISEPTTNNQGAIFFNNRDIYYQEDYFYFKLTVFKNLLPEPKLTITNVNNVSPYEVRFDGSASYDKDEKYGGAISRYYFDLGNNYTVETSNPIVYRVFPGPGTYIIKFRVKDNDNEWSDFIQRTITLN